MKRKSFDSFQPIAKGQLYAIYMGLAVNTEHAKPSN
ncbi:MAG: hypothetical protein RL660_1333 [Bacteroidota bacterium]|jgi:hypothetical protein